MKDGPYVSSPTDIAKLCGLLTGLICVVVTIVLLLVGDVDPASELYRKGFRSRTAVFAFIVGTLVAMTAVVSFLIVCFVPKRSLFVENGRLTIETLNLITQAAETRSFSDAEIEAVVFVDTPKVKRLVARVRGEDVILMERSLINRTRFAQLQTLLDRRFGVLPY